MSELFLKICFVFEITSNPIAKADGTRRRRESSARDRERETFSIVRFFCARAKTERDRGSID
jgi:hypothetical protein